MIVGTTEAAAILNISTSRLRVLLSNNGISVYSGQEEFEQTHQKTQSSLVNLYGHEVEILGGCRVVYRPDHPKYGAKVWYFGYAQYED